MNREETALALRKKGYNCAQATVCADLKGLKTGHMLYACEDCIRLAVRLTEQIVFEDAE